MQSPTIETVPSEEPFAVFEVTGELDLDTQDGFEAQVGLLLKDGSVVVDLTRLEFLAICSLRSLVSCERSATEEHRRVVYAGTPVQARRLLALSGLDGMLNLSPTVIGASELVAHG